MLAAACVLCSLSVIAIQPGSLAETLSMFWKDKLLFLLNGFPVCVVIVLCYFALGNPFAAAGLGGLLVNLMSYVNLVKTDCRNDPFVPADFTLLREAMNAAGEYTLNLHWDILLGILALSAGCFLLAYFRPGAPAPVVCPRGGRRWWCWGALSGACPMCTRRPAFIVCAARA